MTPPKQKPRRLTELYKDLLEVEKKQQEFTKQKKKFIKEFKNVQSQLDKLEKEVKKNDGKKPQAKLHQEVKNLQEKRQIVQDQLTETAITIAKIQDQNNSLQSQIKEAKAKLNQHITKAQNSKNKDLVSKAQGAQTELDSYDKLVKKTKESIKKAEEKIKSDYIKERDNLFESAQNICSKTEQITPAVKKILRIDFTKNAFGQKKKFAGVAVAAITTGLDNSISIAKIVTSTGYYVKEAKKIDIADRAKTEDSFFVKLLSDGKTQELLKNTLPQINKVANEVAPILVSKTLDYLEKTGKKYEKQEAKSKDFATRKGEIILQVAEYSREDQKLPKELQQQFDAIKKEEEAISKDKTSEKQSSIRQSLGKTISALKNRGFGDEHINSTFVPIMSSVIHNASEKPQEVTGAIKAVVDLGLAANSQEQAKAVTKLLLSEIVRDTLKDQAIQNLATNQTGFITATIQEIVKNNNSLKERAEKVGVTDDSISDLTEMATGVATIGLKFGGKLLDGLSKENTKVEGLVEVTINAGKKIAGIIDSNEEIGPEHITQITNEAKIVANNALELMNQDSVKEVIKTLSTDIAQDKELPAIIKQGVKTIATIAAPNVAKLGNFSTVVDFVVDLGLNVTVAGLEGADEVNSLVRNTVLPVALNVGSAVVKNRDKIDTLAKQIKNINAESKAQQVDNPVEKATSAINNGLEVASKITHFLNEEEIRESLTQNLSKLGQDLQSAKYVENLVTTVAQNILPASEIIGDRDTVNRVIVGTAILVEQTAAAVLSEEKNISAIFDAATNGISVAKSLLSSDKPTVETADSISKVVESAAVLLTDENVSKVISEKIPDYIATHGQTFMDAVTSQFATRRAKKAALASKEVLIEESMLVESEAQEKNAEIVAEQPEASHQVQQENTEITIEQPAASDEVQVTDSEAAPNKKPSSRDKAIEVATTVAKNVTNVLSVLQSEEGRKSKEMIVSNLIKLGDQIEKEHYIQKIVPKMFDSLISLEKENSPAIKEQSAESMQENQSKPLDIDHQKDPMAPEEIKITSQDIVQTAKSIKDIKNISQFVQDSSVLTEKIISRALSQSGAAINIATSLIELGQNASEVLTRKPMDLVEKEQVHTINQEAEMLELTAENVSNTLKQKRDAKAKKIVADDRELVQNLNNTLAKNILIIANDSKIQDLVTNDLPEYVQGNKDTILAITKQLTGQYQAQIEAIGLSEELINQTAGLSIKLLTDKNIAPIYELVGNVVNNAGISNGGTQSDIASLIDHIYNVVINTSNKEVRKESVENVINKIGDIIFSANTANQVRLVVTKNIPTLLRENEKAIAGLAEEFLERTKVGQKISSRISIDVERALKVAEKKSGTLLSLLKNYHKKNYTGIVKNVIDLATSPKVIKFLGSTAARTVSSHVKRLRQNRKAPMRGR